MIVVYLLCCVVVFIIYVKWCQSYWQRKGLPYLKPEFFFGFTKKILKNEISFGDSVLERYKEAKTLSSPYVGIYFLLSANLLIIDPKLIKHVLLKDFNYFMDRGLYYHPKDFLTNNLICMEGTKWRELRTKLTPTFTSVKMKMMFETFAEKSRILSNVVKKHLTNNIPIDIKDVLSRFSTDTIGSCAFGIECDSLTDPSNEFRKYGKKSFERWFGRFICRILPKSLAHNLRITRSSRDVTEFFSSIVKQTIKTREENNISRKDFMNLLLQLKNQNDENVSSLTEEEIIGQCYIFFLAGFETSSTTMTFALLELAQNLDIQDKVRSEIMEVLLRHHGEISYDSVMDMHYLDKVINETLRKYPPVPSLPRICIKDYIIPNTNVKINKGTRVEIPVFGIHRDEKYYPNPEVFDPERFSQEQIAKRPDFTFLPFGEGPRMCIGLRFGLLQSKLGLVYLINSYKFTINRKTALPVKLAKGNNLFVLSVDGDVWLDVSKV